MSDTSRAQKPVVTPVRVVIALCLFTPFVAILWVGSYSRTEPDYLGLPFFYWYQLAWVPLSAVLTFVAYRLWNRDQRIRRAAANAPASAQGEKR